MESFDGQRTNDQREPTTLGMILINDSLPPKYRRRRVFDKKAVHELFMQLANEDPDLYTQVLHDLSDLGASVAWTEGASVSLSSLRATPRKQALLTEFREKLYHVLNDDTLDDEQRNAAIVELAKPYVDRMRDLVVEEAREEESPYMIQIESGARGKKADLNSLRGADILVTDQNDQFIPVPVLHSYADGLTPAEWFATSYGQRKGAIGVKFATSDAGFYTKRLSNAAHRFVVTHEQPRAWRHPVGLPVPTDDADNIGAVLAAPAGPYAAGTVITKDVLDDLSDAGIDEILIHSPMTEYTEDNGISRLAAGRRIHGQQLTPVGENIGLQAAQAIGERLSQGALSSKHAAGVSDTRARRSGFVYLNRLVEAPEHFPEASPLSDVNGVVTAVRPLPQGGHEIVIGDRSYYLPAQQHPIVRPGDNVEVGDPLGDGVPHPKQLVELRGIGEARRVLMQYYREALQDSGAPAHRRNIEPVIAGLLNWVEAVDVAPEDQDHDGVPDAVPGDVVFANRVFARYTPRPDSLDLEPSAAVGMYLEEPVLHYTPGTYVTHKVADTLKKWGIPSVLAHRSPPWFAPRFVRSVYSVYYDPDWRTKLLGFYTTRAFLESVRRGAVSDTMSTSYVPALAKPSTFGQNLPSLGKYGFLRNLFARC